MRTELTFPRAQVIDAAGIADEYLGSLDSDQSRRVQRSALHKIATHCDPSASWDTFPWHRLRWDHLRALREWIADQYELATANRFLVAIRGVLKAAFRLQRLSADDYMRLAQIESVSGERLTRGEALTIEQVRALYAACGAGVQGTRDRALLACLVPLGLRRAEVVSLDVGSYAPQRQALLVRGKGNRERIVPMGDATSLVFATWLECHPSPRTPQAALLCRMTWDHLPIEGTRLHSNAVIHVLDRLTTAAGLKHHGSHDLRKTTITLAEEASISEVVMANLIGHKSVDTTRRHYSMRKERSMRDAVSSLERAIGKRDAT